MFEYVLHRIWFDRKGYPHDDENYNERVFNDIESALQTQVLEQTKDIVNNDRNKGYYIEHRIKLDYAK